MHMHSTDWYMLARNGRPPPAWERCLKETFLLEPGERIVVAAPLLATSPASTRSTATCSTTRTTA